MLKLGLNKESRAAMDNGMQRIVIAACILPGKEMIEGPAVQQKKSYALTTGYRRQVRTNSIEALILEYEEVIENKRSY